MLPLAQLKPAFLPDLGGFFLRTILFGVNLGRLIGNDLRPITPPGGSLLAVLSESPSVAGAAIPVLEQNSRR